MSRRARGTGAHGPESFPRVDPSFVAVVPRRPDGVRAYGVERHGLPPTPGRLAEYLRIGEFPHPVMPSLATRAWTSAAQRIQRVDGGVIVLPRDAEQLVCGVQRDLFWSHAFAINPDAAGVDTWVV